MGTFTPLDIAVVIILLGFGLFSFLRGFTRQVLSVGAWVGAIVITYMAFEPARNYLRGHITSPLGADLAAGAAVFLVALLVLSILTKAISDRIRNSAFSNVDSVLGFGLGIAMGGVVLSAAYIGGTMLFEKEPPDWLTKAKSKPYLEQGASFVRTFVPENFGVIAEKAKSAGDQVQGLMEAEQALRTHLEPRPTSAPVAAPVPIPAPAPVVAVPAQAPVSAPVVRSSPRAH